MYYKQRCNAALGASGHWPGRLAYVRESCRTSRACTASPLLSRAKWFRLQPVPVASSHRRSSNGTARFVVSSMCFSVSPSYAYDAMHLNGSARSWIHERFARHTQGSHSSC
jgi:hypothetical protein